ncbi:hypothetical protein MKZ38_002103 [Zalerion maritima]|uniref:Uncharacterized protein n=1 Tax=Zalerion maritima TaxID=339359 RepID=A0AAD5RQQ1_9PEZI|nr:hypothetical protein MKZ38_002103 [Zalerion maritima]
MSRGNRTGLIHHLGTFLLLAATALLIVTDITAPVVNNIALLKVDTPYIDGARMTQISYGTFGYCILDANPDGGDVDICTPKQIGYRPIEPAVEWDETDFSVYADRTTKILSRVMVLHPVATGMAFIAFLLALGSGIVGSLLASLLSCLTFLTTLCVLICDFVLFGMIKSNINQGDNGIGSHAYYSVGMWTTLAAQGEGKQEGQGRERESAQEEQGRKVEVLAEEETC